MLRRALCVSAALVLLTATAFADEDRPDPREEEARKDLQEMQGTWKLESLEDSKKGAKVDVKKRTLFFGGELCLLRDGDKVLQIGVARLVTSKSPRRIDVVVRKGLHQDSTMLGIYEVKDDTLKVCFDPEGEGRPSTFETKADTSRFVAVYKRVKPAGEAIDIRGKFTSTSFGPDGKKQSMTAEIEKRGDAYMVRWTVPGGVAYIGMGLRKGDILSVTWANRGNVGLSVYKIEKGPKLVGDYTELGGVGIVAHEEMTPAKSDWVEARLRR
jgi:uncharacterized protein (TIGR03067 family)